MSSVRSFTLTSLNGSFPLSDSCWLISKPLALPAGVYGCYSHKSFQHTSNFPREIISLACAIFYTSYAITRRPYATTSSLLGLGHHTGPSAPQHRPCRSVDFKHIRPTPLWNPLHRINDIDLVRHETDKSLL